MADDSRDTCQHIVRGSWIKIVSQEPILLTRIHFNPIMDK